MTDSYVSTSNGDALSANGTASKMNGSTPSLPQTTDSAAPPIIRKKLNGYVGFANLPNQVHRKSVRKGFQFTAMVVGTHRCHVAYPHVCHELTSLITGESGLGKSTLINTLFNTRLYPPKEPLPPSAERPQTVAIESISAGRMSNTSDLTPCSSSPQSRY